MELLNKQLLHLLEKDVALSKAFFKGNFGLEKENLRVDRNGHLALTPHPAIFGPKEDNCNIKTDFSESQVEMITPVCGSVNEVYDALHNLNNIVNNEIGEELLWPSSNPAILPPEKDIPIAVYKTKDSEHRVYREHLAKEYGKKIQLLSGIHYNFSFAEDFLKQLYEKSAPEDTTYHTFKNQLYMQVASYFMKKRWLLVYLTGASPVFENDFTTISNARPLNQNSSYLPTGMSLRNSAHGYKNSEPLNVKYDTFENYIQSIANYIEAGTIDSMREYYNPIRLKNAHTDQTLESLAEKGVEYLEIRSIDLNPFELNGISKKTLHLIHLMFLTALLTNQDDITWETAAASIEANEDLIARNGLSQPDLQLHPEGKIAFQEAAQQELDKMQQIIETLAPDQQHLLEVISEHRAMVDDPQQTIAAKSISAAQKDGFIASNLALAADYQEKSYGLAYQLKGAENMELSTQIIWKDALKRGIKTEVLDATDNFLAFSVGDHIEYVKQASKTAKDNYVSVLVMENKVVTKKILAKHGMNVPFGENFTDIETAQSAYPLFTGKAIVVKPKSTNYGWGISIFKDAFTEKDFQEALKIAFSYDEAVIIEEFIEGDEYRFLVIDDKVEAVLKRIPANVTGDGKHTVQELVDQKNADPLRGTDHLKPLEKILTGPEETLMLSMQQYSWESIPETGKTIYLRENSNISTGGDSIDFTDQMPDFYKEIAIQCTQIVDAHICGVDIIIPSIHDEAHKHGIIELNFNPAMHMHCFPYEGERKKIGDKILDYLFPEKRGF